MLMSEQEQKLKRGSFVKVKSTGTISILADIQPEHNRYQLKNVSGWQYGIDNLEHLNNESLLDEINRLQEQRDNLMIWAKIALIGAKHESCKWTKDDPDPTWHCCNWSEVVEEAEKIGVTVE